MPVSSSGITGSAFPEWRFPSYRNRRFPWPDRRCKTVRNTHTSYIIGNMFDILEKGMMRDYYFLTIILFGINMFSIYIMKKAGIIDALISFFVSKSIKENIVKQLVKSDKNINIGEILDIISYVIIPWWQSHRFR